MRKWITLVEAATFEAPQAFYHATDRELPIGYILDRSEDSTPFKDNRNDDQMIEALRPADSLPRDCIYMSDNPGTWWGNIVYEVQPLGKVERNDDSWLDAAAVAGFDQETDQYLPDWPEERRIAEKKRLIQQYWSGATLDGNYEYRTKRAKIVRRVR